MYCHSTSEKAQLISARIRLFSLQDYSLGHGRRVGLVDAVFTVVSALSVEVDPLVGPLDDEVEVVAEGVVDADVWSGVEISEVDSVDSGPTDEIVEGDSACVVSTDDSVATVDGGNEVDGDSVGSSISTWCPEMFHGVVVCIPEKKACKRQTTSTNPENWLRSQKKKAFYSYGYGKHVKNNL
ncbi:hypothetical protein Y032_0031g2330 [Ancylostoma ceylanicum]|uniref:Uncharacterized protein n=1 Tax=Ancylostoma ceylanicum TaxID=53326 RepID=A0A016UPU9_9BILA|nr:hypothetical protein Y032_0031g2330 [Ancylostoma ceylanicum]